MMEVAEAFRAGGIWMYALLAVAIFALGASALAGLAIAFAKQSMALYATGGLAVSLGVLALLIGIAGYSIGLREVDQAVEYAAPEHRAELMARGHELATIPMKFGLVITVLPFLVGGVAIGLGVRRQ